jgi:hypothetical protein
MRQMPGGQWVAFDVGFDAQVHECGRPPARPPKPVSGASHGRTVDSSLPFEVPDVNISVPGRLPRSPAKPPSPAQKVPDANINVRRKPARPPAIPPSPGHPLPQARAETSIPWGCLVWVGIILALIVLGSL